ncbi:MULTISPECIES: LysE family translocator [Pseudomonas]|uniref:LysE family translocator n=1 Tax=Pseudomonas juntendi TaxID=2666183 RepID=A0A7W2LU22_9PSED|nr:MULTISPECIES: LysE family translocator [Pseudomonas]NOY02638.1 LysE family translocator [Gammaproteobacteria bacterium]QOH69902.1 LysE family translocator [Pseudomonas putida]MBA6130562.1 LysE family translocator [Pseudomonas juntendi]MBA6147090.1 LysE family translocator [Pseudomonas juntendi]MCK2111825.1 LysE family translocator [Pseudomonas juntendi]
MQIFLIVALAHFLALLSPGPDFFLVARTSVSSGWRSASGVCLGIALANGAFITVAFTGLSMLQEGSPLFASLQLVGAVYLVYIGMLFLRHAGHTRLTAAVGKHTGPGWWQGLGMGLLSALLNPKNALFYASLASMVGSASVGWKAACALWMFGVVLLWDLLIAVAIGNQRVLRRFARWLPWLERSSGIMLVLLGAAVLLHLAWG